MNLELLSRRAKWIVELGGGCWIKAGVYQLS